MPGETPPTNAALGPPQLTESLSSRKDGGPAGLFGNTQEARHALSRELVGVQVVNINDFLQLILPLQSLTDPTTPLPAVSDIVQKLKDSGALVPSHFPEQKPFVDPDTSLPAVDDLIRELEGGPADIPDPKPAKKTIFRWETFDQLPSEMNGVHETTVFSRMVTIVDQIEDAVAARHGPSPTMAYMDEPNRPPTSDRRQNSTRPDGYFYFDPDKNLSQREARKWYNVGVVAEFKKYRSPGDIHDNVHKILWGMNHIMREDPTRRYALGFTIENRTMMLWYCDRSQVVVSTAFDFIQMPDLLIDFFVRVMYAPRSSLGCDPTMELVPNARGGPPKYKINIYNVDASGRVTTHQYIANTIISDAAADGIVTRGTRVWSARELDGKKRKCVIKDYWVDYDRDAEGDILARIKNAFPAGNPHHNTLHRHLLTVLSHGKVPRDILFPLVADTTLVIPESSRAGDEFYWVAHLDGVMSMARNSAPNTRTFHGPSSFVDRFNKDIKQHGRRSHLRIAFAEEGKPLHQVTSLGTVFSALFDIAECLTALHAAGWVHRDLSPGNILIVQGKDGPRGLLANFEYAKHRDDMRGVHSVRTGTLYFMSGEVDAGKYLFSGGSDRAGFQLQLDPTAGVLENQDTVFGDTKTPPSFRYHPLNDWESVFWIATHFTIDREIKEEAAIVDGHLQVRNMVPQTAENRARQIQWARQLFYERATRQRIFISAVDSEFASMNQCVHQSIKFLAVWQLEDMRLALVSAYRNAEMGQTPPTFDKSANSGAACLIKNCLRWVKIYLTQSAHITVGHFEVPPPPRVPEEPTMPTEPEERGVHPDVHPMVTHIEHFPSLNVLPTS